MEETKTLQIQEAISDVFLKTVSAYANYNGGKIVFGIDEDGKVLGIADSKSKCKFIEKKIADSIKPKLAYYKAVAKEDGTIELTVRAGLETPYLYRSKAYKRDNTKTVEVDPFELTRLYQRVSSRKYEELPADDQVLTFDTLDRKLNEATGIEHADGNILKLLKLYSDKEGYNMAAELLSDDNTHPGITVKKYGATDSVIRKQARFENDSILKEYEDACEMYRDYYQYEKLEGDTHSVEETIPESAFCEAIANALAHRSWTRENEIRVFMFDDRIEIEVPGGLPKGTTKEEYFAGVCTRIRNPILCNTMYRLDLTEMPGAGHKKIKTAYEKSVSKPEYEFKEDMIKVTLPAIKTEGALKGDYAIIYDALPDNEGRSVGELAEIVPFGKSKIREILQALNAQKLVEITGNGRGTKYHKK